MIYIAKTNEVNVNGYVFTLPSMARLASICQYQREQSRRVSIFGRFVEKVARQGPFTVARITSSLLRKMRRDSGVTEEEFLVILKLTRERRALLGDATIYVVDVDG